MHTYYIYIHHASLSLSCAPIPHARAETARGWCMLTAPPQNRRHSATTKRERITMRTGTTMEGAACAVNPASTGALCAQRTCSTFLKWAQALALPSVVSVPRASLPLLLSFLPPRTTSRAARSLASTALCAARTALCVRAERQALLHACAAPSGLCMVT